jgi:hypothetical protein
MPHHPAEHWWAGLDEAAQHQALLAASPDDVISDRVWHQVVNSAVKQRVVRRKVSLGEHQLPDPYLDFVRTLIDNLPLTHTHMCDERRLTLCRLRAPLPAGSGHPQTASGDTRTVGARRKSLVHVNADPAASTVESALAHSDPAGPARAAR